MRIEYEQSGGYPGVRLTYRVDTDEVPRELAEEVVGLVKSSGIQDFHQQEAPSGSTRYRGALHYRLSILGDGAKRSFSFTDETVPAKLRPLLTLLQKLAIEQRRKGV